MKTHRKIETTPIRKKSEVEAELARAGNLAEVHPINSLSESEDFARTKELNEPELSPPTDVGSSAEPEPPRFREDQKIP